MAFTAGAALGLLFFVTCAWLITVQYGLGSVRGALDEGVRAGALSGRDASVCEEVAFQTLAQLLGGSFAQVRSVRCWPAGSQLMAEAAGSFGSWVPGAPDWSFTVRASSVAEP